MNQYCRYCSHLCDNVCTIKNRGLKDSTIKSPNHCKKYAFCNIDVETGKEYHPRKTKDSRQMKLFELD